ncbi:MAG: hypothetical protein ACKVZJ_02840 [Phycisphaerales bacterium]
MTLAWLAASALFCAPVSSGAGRQAEGSRWHTEIATAESDPTALDAIRRELGPSADPAARLEVLRALENFEPPEGEATAGLPPSLGPVVAGVLQQPVDAETLVVALRAMSRFQSRESVGAVLRFARSAKDIHQRPELVAEALSALSRQTGRVDPREDVESWERWFSEVPGDPAVWYQALTRLQAERAARAAADAGASDARLAGVYRRLLVSLPEKDRDAVLAEMIASDAPEVRALGFDQTTRSVLNGVKAGPVVTAAAIARLRDPAPSLRILAADLLEKLDDPTIGPAAASALSHESAPLPAASILRVLVKRPEPSALRDIAPWLDSIGPAFAPAVDAALALDRAGVVSDPDLVARMKDVLSSLPASRHTPGSVELLARVGGVESVAGLLDAGDPEVAQAAARAAAGSPELLDRIVASASKRAALFESAVAALARHRPTAAGFAQAEGLPAPSAEKAQTALSAFASALPPRELLDVCRAQAELSARERFASVASAPEYVSSASVDERPARADLATLLAHTRLQQKNPAAALAGLESACLSDAPLVGPPTNGTGAPPPNGASPSDFDCEAWSAPARVTALAWLGRLDEALQLSRRFGVTPEPWLDVLAWASDQPHAPAIESAIRELFSTRLTPEQTARMEAARQPSVNTP